jgi:hypothetical protein
VVDGEQQHGFHGRNAKEPGSKSGTVLEVERLVKSLLDSVANIVLVSWRFDHFEIGLDVTGNAVHGLMIDGGDSGAQRGMARDQSCKRSL